MNLITQFSNNFTVNNSNTNNKNAINTNATKYPQNVNKRHIIFRALINSKPPDFDISLGNSLYNYGCENNDDIVKYIKCFSNYEKYYLMLKVGREMKTEYGYEETKTDIEEDCGNSPNADLRNRILDHLYFSEKELENLEVKLSDFKLFLHNCINEKDRPIWFKQRKPILSNILKNYEEFSHLELIILRNHLIKKLNESKY